MDDDDGFDLLRGYGVYVHLCTVQIGADRGRAEYMVRAATTMDDPIARQNFSNKVFSNVQDGLHQYGLELRSVRVVETKTDTIETKPDAVEAETDAIDIEPEAV